MWMLILYPSAREKKNENRLDLTPEDDLRCALSTTQPRIDNLVENTTREQKSHYSLFRGCFVMLMLKSNKIRCIIVKHIFCLLILVPKWRLRVDFSIVLWLWATAFCWKQQMGHGIKKVGNHWSTYSCLPQLYICQKYQTTYCNCKRQFLLKWNTFHVNCTKIIQCKSCIIYVRKTQFHRKITVSSLFRINCSKMLIKTTLSIL